MGYDEAKYYNCFSSKCLFSIFKLPWAIFHFQIHVNTHTMHMPWATLTREISSPTTQINGVSVTCRWLYHVGTSIQHGVGAFWWMIRAACGNLMHTRRKPCIVRPSQLFSDSLAPQDTPTKASNAFEIKRFWRQIFSWLQSVACVGDWDIYTLGVAHGGEKMFLREHCALYAPSAFFFRTQRPHGFHVRACRKHTTST